MDRADQHDWIDVEELENQIAHIAELLIQGRIGFLFGSGMSIPSGGIGGRELAFRLILKALYKHLHDPLEPSFEEDLKDVAQKYPLEAIAEGIVPDLPWQEIGLVELLKKGIFGDDGPKLHDGHKSLAVLVKRFNLKMLFTTNWDELLKEALGRSAEIITNENKKYLELDQIVAQKTAIIHLHGTFDDHPLIRESDLMDPDQPLFQLFLSELLGKSFVFVGYSLSDQIIRALYFRAKDILVKRKDKLNKITYIVSPSSNDIEYRVSKKTWEGRGAKYIPIGAEEFFKRLYDEVMTYKVDELKKRLKQRLKVTPEELNKKVEEILAIFPDFGTPEQVLVYLDAITQRGKE